MIHYYLHTKIHIPLIISLNISAYLCKSMRVNMNCMIKLETPYLICVLIIITINEFLKFQLVIFYKECGVEE